MTFAGKRQIHFEFYYNLFLTGFSCVRFSYLVQVATANSSVQFPIIIMFSMNIINTFYDFHLFPALFDQKMWRNKRKSSRTTFFVTAKLRHFPSSFEKNFIKHFFSCNNDIEKNPFGILHFHKPISYIWYAFVRIRIFFCVMIIMCRISNGLIFLWIWCHLTRSTCTHYINKRLNENSFIILNRTRFAIQKLRGRKFKWLKSIKRLLIMRRMWICINIGALFSFHHWKMEQ